MSVAFTREEDAEAAAAHLPDRPISLHPNVVTPEGLAHLDAALAAARAAHAAAQAEGLAGSDRSAIARATRDVRYYAARRASAQLMQAGPDSNTIQFGGRVTIERTDGRLQSFRIVGEDEADAAAGSISYVSPLARAVLGRQIGDTVTLNGSDIEIVDGS